MNLIPVFRPAYDEEEVSAVADVLRSGWIGMGQKTVAFERAFAQYLGVPSAVAVNSGTAALHLACIAADIQEGDEVIVPALTFASTGLAPLMCRAHLVFADIKETTLTLDPKDVARKITPRTKAIIVVHYGGTPAALEELEGLAKKHNITLIEDAAHACGTTYHDKKIGARGNLTCFSFHAVKNLATGDGGMIIPRNETEERRLKALRWCGIDRDTWSRENQSERRYDWYYEIRELGYKYHPTDITSALGLVQLQKLDRLNDRRRAHAASYRSLLRTYPWITLPKEREETINACHNFVIRIEEREDFRLFLSQQMISTGVHYLPLTKHPVFAAFTTALPITDRIAAELVTLPLFPDLSEEEMAHICGTIAAYDAKRKTYKTAEHVLEKVAEGKE